jgi:CTD kinase subunit gamma
MMADPFEVRMRFTAQLQHLNASVTSSQKAAHYALKYRDMDEDLHSCILEQLERVCMPVFGIYFGVLLGTDWALPE